MSYVLLIDVIMEINSVYVGCRPLLGFGFLLYYLLHKYLHVNVTVDLSNASQYTSPMFESDQVPISRFVNKREEALTL